MEQLSEDDLRSLIYEDKGIDLPSDWSKDQILIWWEENENVAPEDIEIPEEEEGGTPETPEEEEGGTPETPEEEGETPEEEYPLRSPTKTVPSEFTVPLSSAALEVRSPKSPVSESLTTISPRSQLSRTFQAMQAIQEQPQGPLAQLGQQRPTSGQPRRVPTPIPISTTAISQPSTQALPEKLKLDTIPVPRAFQPMQYVPRTARAQGSIVEAPELSTLQKVQATSGIPVNPEATFQPKAKMETTKPVLEPEMKMPTGEAYTEKELERMTIKQLQPLVKSHGLKVGRKAEMIAALLKVGAMKEPEVKTRILTGTEAPSEGKEEILPPQEVKPVTPAEIKPPSSGVNVYTKDELNRMTVKELQPIIRSLGLKVPKLKGDMVALLEGKAKPGAPQPPSQPPAPLPSPVRPQPEPSQVYTGKTMTELTPLRPISEVIEEIQPIETSISVAEPIPVTEEISVPVYTKDELNRMTVKQLQPIIRSLGLKMPKLKGDMVALLEGKAKPGAPQAPSPVKQPPQPSPVRPISPMPSLIRPLAPLTIEPTVSPKPVIAPQAIEVQAPQPSIIQPPVTPIIPQPPVTPVGELYTKSELGALTVIKLKELLKANNLKIPRLKADMVEALIQNKVSKAPTPQAQPIQPPVTPVQPIQPPMPEPTIIPQRVQPSPQKPSMEGELYTAEELNRMTVKQLQPMVRAMGLKLPKLKADIVQTLLDNKAKKNQ